MPQLIVQQVEESVVKKLEAQARRQGVSMEEEPRRILREALLGQSGKRVSLEEYLLQMPEAGADEVFERGEAKSRDAFEAEGGLEK